MNPTQFYKCLADETRLKLLLLIAELGPTCVCKLMEALEMDQPKISRNLAQLRQCNIVEAERHGKWMFYRLSDTLPEWALHVIVTTAEHNKAFYRHALKRIEHDTSATALKGCEVL